MDVLLAILIGLIIAAVLAWPTGRYTTTWDWPLFWFFFLILFMAVWAGGVWVEPVGPAVGGVFWVPSLVIGLIIALILLAVLPSRPVQRRAEAVEAEEVEASPAVVAFGIFFWVLLLALLALALLGYAF